MKPMKYLIIDDQLEHIKLPVRTLREAGHEVKTARHLDDGWRLIQHEREHPFDLVTLDLALDRRSQEFAEEQQIIWGTSKISGQGNDPYTSGQALGLRLWRRRRKMQQCYCYITQHRDYWMAQLDEEDPEFEQKASELRLKWIPELILDKSGLRANNVAEKLETAWKIWNNSGWLD
uniref:Response regulator receiver domain-containing protein n=1 Tax=Candidatus Kentrum sp. SD TaxID=2126332 RepID=A0A450YQS7_9GAMM|nr:MAG: hypothetical protein BECKSD772F_GA0070984_10324 [Candidatus Kentron sp. SD]VFK43911.1 MAG: hypothetical protein BECKSD772E_GA0070983_10314 [Candidatus Kentron sp. SD]